MNWSYSIWEQLFSLALMNLIYYVIITYYSSILSKSYKMSCINYVDDLNEDMTAHIEITPGQSGNFPLPMNSEEMAAEEALFCAEHDDYFQACGCGSMAAKPVVEVKAAEVKSTSGSPKQQAWRSCVRDAKGDMAKAKQMYTSMGY